MSCLHRLLHIEDLNNASFSRFGDVIDAESAAETFVINSGYATRLHNLAQVDVSDFGGQPIISIFQARAREMPLRIECMERHPLGSQAFIPMQAALFLVVVAPAGEQLDLDALRCFIAKPGQGVNYSKGVWHHPLISLTQDCNFAVIDRSTTSHINLEEVHVSGEEIWVDRPV